MNIKKRDRVQEVLKAQLTAVYDYLRYDEEITVFVLKKTDFDRLEQVKNILKKERFIFLTEEDIKEGQDVFPLQLLHIREHSLLVSGKDVLKSLKLKKADVRRKLEYELRNKNVYLREEFVGTKNLKDLLPTILPRFVVMMEALLYLKGRKYSQDIVADMALVQEDYDVNLLVFAELVGTPKLQKLSSKEVLSIIKRVSKALQELSHIINKFSV